MSFANCQRFLAKGRQDQKQDKAPKPCKMVTKFDKPQEHKIGTIFQTYVPSWAEIKFGQKLNHLNLIKLDSLYCPWLG